MSNRRSVNRGFRGAAWLLAGAAVVACASPTMAQSRSRRGHSHPSQVQVLPPEPLMPGSLGLLERDFQYMRRTSPNPNAFMGGRFNPRVVQTPAPIIQPWPSYPYYGGGYYGYPQNYGYGQPPVAINQPVIIVVPGGGGNSQFQPNTNRAPEVPSDYYLDRGARKESLQQALDDLRVGWLNGDYERLRDRLPASGKVRVYVKGEYRYAVDASDFSKMTQSALERLDTTGFEIEKVVEDGTNSAFVTGKHTFLDGDGKKVTTYVSYRLSREGGRWRIVEAGSSSEPITKHVDEAPKPADEKPKQ